MPIDQTEAQSWTNTAQFKDAETRIRQRWVGDWGEGNGFSWTVP